MPRRPAGNLCDCLRIFADFTNLIFPSSLLLDVRPAFNFISFGQPLVLRAEHRAIPTFLLGSESKSNKVRCIESVGGISNGVAFVKVPLLTVYATLSNREPLAKLCFFV